HSESDQVSDTKDFRDSEDLRRPEVSEDLKYQTLKNDKLIKSYSMIYND
ncbi:hypothetical protein A2U01_0061627, partial [Trifolium medium]|nr:hypothetical protein [Trifolium medium]